MNILASLRTFDGKHTDILEQLNATLPRNDNSLEELLAIATHDNVQLQVGSTWILKRWHDEGEPIIETRIPTFVEVLIHAEYWEVRLHMLQILATISIPPNIAAALKKTLRKLLTEDNKFVRGWAYSVFASIGDQDSSCRKQILSLLNEAENDEAASVKARVRQIRKRYSWAKPSNS